MADTVEKVFFDGRRKFFSAADASCAPGREGTHRSTQKRPRIFVSAPKTLEAPEASKNHLSRDFRRRSIFDFCNSIGTFRTCRGGPTMSVHRGKADIAVERAGG